MSSSRLFRTNTFWGASALALIAFSGPALAEQPFTTPADAFVGQVRGASSEQGAPLYQGGKATISGQGLLPGQEVTLLRGTTALNSAPITVDGEGKFSFELTLPTDAALGLQPIVVVTEKPASAEVIELKVSPKIELSGAEKFAVTSEPVTRGLYQVAQSATDGALFVTAAVGRPPVKESSLQKLDPQTLKVLASVSMAAAPARADGSEGGLIAAYGVAVDDANGTVWITNTRQNTVAVYRQSDLSLVKQFEPGAVNHSRDVVVDQANGRAYVSAAFTGTIAVFDTATLEPLPPIEIASTKRGEDFTTMSLDLDAKGGKLFTVSMQSDEAAVVDLATGAAHVFPLAGAVGASGVAYDPQEDLLFVASQSSDNLLIAEATSGEVLYDTDVGAGPLSVAFDPVNRLAYVANRGAGTLTVVNTEGEIVGNLDGGTFPNQVKADGKGGVYVINKSRGENDPQGDRIAHILPASQ